MVITGPHAEAFGSRNNPTRAPRMSAWYLVGRSPAMAESAHTELRLPTARVAWWWCGLTVAATVAYLVVDDATRSILLLVAAVSGIVGVSVGATRIGPRVRWPWYLISVAGTFFLVGAILRASL